MGSISLPADTNQALYVNWDFSDIFNGLAFQPCMSSYHTCFLTFWCDSGFQVKVYVLPIAVADFTTYIFTPAILVY